MLGGPHGAPAPRSPRAGACTTTPDVLSILLLRLRERLPSGALAVTTSTTPTRQRLLEAAEHLFATRGIDAVSLAEVTKAAGCRNTGAVHHHFGGREELLAAVVDHHRSGLDERRASLFDELEHAAEVTPALVVRALVLPMAELLDDPRGRAFLSIAAQRALRPRQAGRRPRPLIERLLVLEGRPHGRPPVAAFLADLAELTAASALAQRARLEEAEGRDAGIGRDEFTSQLLAALTRIVTPDEESQP